jgi:hypothetical protein
MTIGRTYCERPACADCVKHEVMNAIRLILGDKSDVSIEDNESVYHSKSPHNTAELKLEVSDGL